MKGFSSLPTRLYATVSQPISKTGGENQLGADACPLSYDGKKSTQTSGKQVKGTTDCVIPKGIDVMGKMLGCLSHRGLGASSGSLKVVEGGRRTGGSSRRAKDGDENSQVEWGTKGKKLKNRGRGKKGGPKVQAKLLRRGLSFGQARWPGATNL